MTSRHCVQARMAAFCQGSGRCTRASPPLSTSLLRIRRCTTLTVSARLEAIRDPNLPVMAPRPSSAPETHPSKDQCREVGQGAPIDAVWGPSSSTQQSLSDQEQVPVQA